MKKRKYQIGGSYPYIDATYTEPLTLEQEETLGDGSIGKGIGGVSLNNIEMDSQGQKKDLFGNILSSIAPGLQIGVGIAELIKARKQKKYFKRQQEIYATELNKKREEQRANDFYYTPYSQPAVMQDGGQVNGGVTDFFMDYYNQQQNKNQTILDLIQGSYQQQNMLNEQRYKDTRQAGFGNIIGGVTTAVNTVKKALTLGMQDGGEIEPTMEDTDDLYSSNFKVDWESNGEVEAQVSEMIEEDDWDSMIGEWLMSEEPEQNYQRQGFSDNPMQEMMAPSNLSAPVISGDYSGLPVSPILDDLAKIGIKPSSVNSGTHSPQSRHYSGRAFDVGINTSFGGDKKKMEDFLVYYNNVLKLKYPNLKLINETIRPKNGEHWTAPHYHLQLD